MEKIKEFIANRKVGLHGAVVAGTLVAGVVPAFAADASTPNVMLTADMLKVIPDTFNANLLVILPVGILIFAILKSTGLLPKVIGWFFR